MYAHGYKADPDIESLNLPNKIKCNRCNVIKNASAYSKKSQYIFKEHVSKDKTNGKRLDPFTAKVVSCSGCTSQQVVELECDNCGKTKGLDKFAKAQRSKAERCCLRCMQDRLNNEPGAASSDEDDSGSGGGDSDDSDGDSTTDTVTDRFANTSLNSQHESSGGGVRLPSTASISAAPSSISTLGVGTGAGWGGWTDKDIAPQSKFGTKPSRAVRDRAPSPTDSIATATTAREDGRKFAKIRAQPQRIEYDAVRREKEENRANRHQKNLDDVEVASSDSEDD